jgi:hypothetical protein
MKSQKKSQYAIMAMLGAVALGVSCTAFVIGSNSFAQEGTLAVEPLLPSDVSNDGAKILAILDEMKSITLDASIFANPMFLNLSDFTVELTPEPISRPNPFAPIGKDVTIVLDSGTTTASSFFSASPTSSDASSFGSQISVPKTPYP